MLKLNLRNKEPIIFGTTAHKDFSAMRGEIRRGGQERRFDHATGQI